MLVHSHANQTDPRLIAEHIDLGSTAVRSSGGVLRQIAKPILAKIRGRDAADKATECGGQICIFVLN